MNAIARKNKLISEISAELQKPLDDIKIEQIGRCSALGLSEENIRCIILAELDFRKTEYVISCFLDDIPQDVICEKIIPCSNTKDMREIKSEVLFESKKNELLMLQNQLEAKIKLITSEKEKLENEFKKMKNVADFYKSNIRELIEEREKIEEKIIALKEELKSKSEEGQKQIIAATMNMKVVKYKKPETLKDKIKYLTGNLELEEEISTEGDEDRLSQISDILCNPDITMEQMEEIQQGFYDGLPIDNLKILATNNMSISKVRVMREFFSKSCDCPYTKIKGKEVNTKDEENSKVVSEEVTEKENIENKDVNNDTEEKEEVNKTDEVEEKEPELGESEADDNKEETFSL